MPIFRRLKAACRPDFFSCRGLTSGDVTKGDERSVRLNRRSEGELWMGNVSGQKIPKEEDKLTLAALDAERYICPALNRPLAALVICDRGSGSVTLINTLLVRLSL